MNGVTHQRSDPPALDGVPEVGIGERSAGLFISEQGAKAEAEVPRLRLPIARS